jgi:hypothetical protein
MPAMSSVQPTEYQLTPETSANDATPPTGQRPE